MPHQADPLSGRRADISEAVISNDSTAKWRIFTNNAAALCGRRQYEEAERALLQALREAKRGFGEEDEHVGAAYCNLAEVYRLMGRHEEALGHYEEALRRLENTRGSSDVSVGRLLYMKGGFHKGRGDHEAAALAFQSALRVYSKALGASHMICREPLVNLVGQLSRLGRHADSINAQAALLALYEKNGVHDGAARAAAELAARQAELRQCDEAMASVCKALSILQTLPEPGEALYKLCDHACQLCRRSADGPPVA